MIPDSFPYSHSGNVELFDQYASATVTNGTTGTVLSFRVPNSIVAGWLTSFGHGIDDPSYFLTAQWTIKINDVPPTYYAQIQDQLAAFNDPKRITPVRIKANDLVTVTVSNGGAAAKLFAARLQGFYDYAASSAKR